MYAIQQAKQEAVAALKRAIGKGFSIHTDDLEHPPNRNMGDLAFPCFILAKEQGRNPAEIATELSAKIGESSLIEKAVPQGPYVNFWFKNDALTGQVLSEILSKKGEYGQSDFGKGRSVLVEYAQPNTHKEFHVGHIRNAVLGQSIVNMLQGVGYKVIAASYIGDIGAHVAKALWGYKEFQGEKEILKTDRTKRLGEIYTLATKQIEEHEEDKKEVDEVQQKLESGDDEWTKLWKETREWSMDEFRRIFKELHVKPDVWYYESEVEGPGKLLVNKMLTEGIAKKSEGATIVDLEEEGLGAFLVLKSDGSSLYATKDLALAIKKEETYAPDRQIFVVDTRQSYYFKQLFATLKRMGFTKKLTHVAYDMVTLPEGAMSSRKGNIVTYDALRNTMVDTLKEETKARHEDWKESKVQEVAETIAGASITFFMLRQDPTTEITFSIEEALSFDGYSGPSILYTIARIERMKKKAGVKPKVQAEMLRTDLEKQLIRMLAMYPQILEEAAQGFKPSIIAQWAFDVSKLFAEYYHAERIIDEDEKELTQAKLALVESVRQVLNNALIMLGIVPAKEM